MKICKLCNKCKPISEFRRYTKCIDCQNEMRRRKNPSTGKYCLGVTRQCLRYKKWRDEILARDDDKCVRCGNKHNRMHCHHIIPWKDSIELRFLVSNGETLCASCHLKEGRQNKEIVNDVNTRFKKGHQTWLGKKLNPEHAEKLRLSNLGKPSWNKGLIRTKEHCENLSKACKGRISPNKGKKGQIAWNKGKPMSEEQKKKISETKLINKGKLL